MVFFRDEGGRFDHTLETVWAFVSSGHSHSRAHGHTSVRRSLRSQTAGTYSWKQPWNGRQVRFTMRWNSYWPAGVAYSVLDGPFEGSRFFLMYEPSGSTTKVSIVGQFSSPTIPEGQVVKAARRFFDVEFAQDSKAMATFAQTRRGRRPRSISPRSTKRTIAQARTRRGGSGISRGG